MTVAELIIKLKECPQHLPVGIYESSNDVGDELDYITIQNLIYNEEKDSMDGADLDTEKGSPYVVLHTKDVE